MTFPRTIARPIPSSGNRLGGSLRVRASAREIEGSPTTRGPRRYPRPPDREGLRFPGGVRRPRTPHWPALVGSNPLGPQKRS
eukprot:7435121-Pyramimonas_sp.AAC.1